MVIKRGEAEVFGEQSCVNRGLSAAREAGLFFASSSLLHLPLAWRCPREPVESWFHAVDSPASFGSGSGGKPSHLWGAWGMQSPV